MGPKPGNRNGENRKSKTVLCALCMVLCVSTRGQSISKFDFDLHFFAFSASFGISESLVSRGDSDGGQLTEELSECVLALLQMSRFLPAL